MPLCSNNVLTKISNILSPSELLQVRRVALETKIHAQSSRHGPWPGGELRRHGAYLGLPRAIR